MNSDDTTPPLEGNPTIDELPEVDGLPTEDTALNMQDTAVDLPAFDLDDDKTDLGEEADTDAGEVSPDETVGGEMMSEDSDEGPQP